MNRRLIGTHTHSVIVKPTQTRVERCVPVPPGLLNPYSVIQLCVCGLALNISRHLCVCLSLCVFVRAGMWRQFSETGPPHFKT